MEKRPERSVAVRRLPPGAGPCASTVTPGSDAPDSSVTRPARPCAGCASSRRETTANARLERESRAARFTKADLLMGSTRETAGRIWPLTLPLRRGSSAQEALVESDLLRAA